MSKKQIVICLSVLFGLVALVGTFVFFKQAIQAEADLNSEISKSKAEGFWVDNLRELDSKGDPSQNAAPIYEQAFVIHQDLDFNNDPKSYFPKVARALMLAEKASRYSYLHFSEKVEGQITVKQRKLMILALDFVQRANFELANSKPAEALADLATCARISHQLWLQEGSPATETMRARVNAERATCFGTAQVLYRFPKYTAGAETVLKDLGDPFPLDGLLRAKMYESFHQLDRPLEAEANCSSPSRRDRQCDDIALSNWPTNRKRWQTGILRYFRRVLEEHKNDSRPSHLIKFTAIAEPPDVKESFDKEGIFANPPWLINYARIYAASIAWRRVLAQGIAILKLKTIPDALPLKGLFARDPSTDAPIHYWHNQNAFKVYATGESGGDFGGRSGGLASDVLFSMNYGSNKLGP